MNQEELKRELLENHEEFRRLHEEHQGHESRLSQLQDRTMLSEQDELEEKQIKRQKLFLKDRMEAILQAHRESSVSA